MVWIPGGDFTMGSDAPDARPDERPAHRVRASGGGGVITCPSGPGTTRDPRNAHSSESRVHRGGSFLCNPSYCSSYRPSARSTLAS